VNRPPRSRGPTIRVLDRVHPALQLKRGRHTVQRLQPLLHDPLPVAVQVDEARTNHQPTHIDGSPTTQMQTHLAHARDAPPVHCHVAHRVRPRLRIDDAPAAQDQFVGRFLV
jgi:hypothetical protein